MINKVLRTRFKAALILSTLLIVAASLVIFGYQGQATSAFPYETIKNSRFGGGGYVQEYVEPTVKGQDGHFGVDGFHAWCPPTDDLPGTPLDELETYFEWESAQLAEAGITWDRTLSPAARPFSWHAIEKTKGDYDFTWADLLVKAAQAQNLSLLGMVAPFTPWDRPDCEETRYRKPNDMNAYKTFMTKLVERYDGDGIDDMPGLKYGIKYWEISNEPDIKFIDGVSGYLETHKAGYEAIKAADPDAKVLNGGACPVYRPDTSEFAQDILDFWDSFFAAGGGDYIDIFNIHYTSPEPAPPLKDFLNQWNTLLNKYSLEKDIWVTETSTYSGSLERWGTTYPTQTEEEQAGWWVKHACYGLAHGVTKLFWAIFYYNTTPTLPDQPEEWQPLAAMLNADKSPKLIYTTQQILSSKIDDFSSVQELAEGQYKFIVDNKPIYVLWGDGTVPAEIEDQIIVTDIYGNEQVMDAAELGLTDNPVFVETAEADILSYYRSYSGDPNVVETTDLLKAADDWASEVTPPGFTEPITTEQLLQLADEWAATPTSSEVIRLYYYGPSALGTDPAALPGAHNIYSTTSSDGTNFEEDPGVRFSYDTESDFGITDPDVVCLNDGSWLMFLSLGSNLLKATAPTSSGTFTHDESFSWDRGGVSGSYNFDGTIRTFVCFQDGINMATYDQNSGTLNYAGVALNPPTSGFIADPSVIQVGNEYLMFYKYAASASVPPTEHEIYLATSADGITWSQHAQNRFICKGSVPGAVYYNDTIYVYYCGLTYEPGVPQDDFGVAISQDNGVTFTTSTITIQGRTAAGAVDPAAGVVNP